MTMTTSITRWVAVCGGLVCLALWPSRAGAGELQNILNESKAFAALPKTKHTPAFRLESFEPVQHRQEAQGKQWWYICDGDERIGLVTTWLNHIELFRFSPEVDKGTKYEIPDIYHWANLIGARLPLQMCGYHSPVPPVESFKITFTKKRGDTLEFKSEQRHKKGYGGSTEYRLAWDARLGYVLNCVSHFAMPQPRQVEFNNLLAGRVCESRDHRKRWQKTMHIPVDDVQAGGFVGFVTEEKMNPFVEMLETSGAVFLATCSQWYDQHIVMKPPKAKEADGLYHMRARYRLLSVPGTVARELEAMAVPRNPATGQSSKAGFLQNKVNDFETFVPHGKVYNGPIWRHINATEGPAHSGTKSIAVRGPGPGQVKAASPIGGGPAIYGESSKRYRLAAWVKTQGLADGGAYLQVDDVFFNWQDAKATRRTKKLTGDRDWTRLEVDFTPSPRDPFLLIKLCVEGTGRAWFDDLELVEVAR
ncbi:MAG: hypothetical protein AMK72_15305 [Planctomycetes bacterium SM23_25]|nr:MAG: hypothetical protein AMK72_15305 [Planctomycetes bacterium SM23_25]